MKTIIFARVVVWRIEKVKKGLIFIVHLNLVREAQNILANCNICKLNVIYLGNKNKYNERTTPSPPINSKRTATLYIREGTSQGE